MRRLGAWLFLALGAGLGAGAQATLPSVEAVIHFTGSKEGGGNGAYPPNGNASINYPSRALVEGEDGYLYGSTAYGGGYEAGSIGYANNGGQGALFYRFRPDTGQSILDRQIDTGNARPVQLTYASNGRLYSIEGASSSAGSLRRYVPGTGWEMLAAAPRTMVGPWIEGADGRLFNIRGSNREVYAVDKEGASGVLTIATLDSSVTSRGTLFLSHSNGRLYGAGAILRNDGSGNAWRPLVFSLLPDGSDFQLHQERIGDAGTYAGSSITALIEADDGRIYGTTLLGGAHDTGTLFRMDADGGNFAALYAFPSTVANTEGQRPNALALGADGHVYGTASLGGVNGGGVIFRWNTALDVYQPLYAFNARVPHTAVGNNTGSNPDGWTPYGLMRASGGQLYGAASLGGQHGWGTVFAFDPGDEVPVFKFEPQLTFKATALSNVGSGSPVPASRIALGRAVTFSWSSQLAANCAASSDEPGDPWQGGRDTVSAGEVHTPAQYGTWTYTLTCDSTSTDFPDPVSASYVIEVVSADPVPESGGNGGGAFVAGLGLLALWPVAGIGVWRRVRRRAR